jgi:hypothetical protein
VVLCEKSTADRIRRTRQALRMSFEAGIHDAARHALAMLHHEEDDQIEHSQYRHFLSRAREGVDAMVLPTRDHNHMGCLPNQVKLTLA